MKRFRVRVLTAFVQSDRYGTELFVRNSKAEALESVKQLLDAAEKQTAKDGVTRHVGLVIEPDNIAL